jgi:hypothetical protein
MAANIFCDWRADVDREDKLEQIREAARKRARKHRAANPEAYREKSNAANFRRRLRMTEEERELNNKKRREARKKKKEAAQAAKAAPPSPRQPGSPVRPISFPFRRAGTTCADQLFPAAPRCWTQDEKAQIEAENKLLYDKMQRKRALAAARRAFIKAARAKEAKEKEAAAAAAAAATAAAAAAAADNLARAAAEGAAVAAEKPVGPFIWGNNNSKRKRAWT